MIHHAMNLIRRGRVFGIVDANNRTACEIECVVQGAWLGAQVRIRHRYDAHPVRQGASGQGVAGEIIVLFDDQHHIEQLAWVIQRAQPFHQPGGDVGFPKHGHHDRHHRFANRKAQRRVGRLAFGTRLGPQLRYRRGDLHGGAEEQGHHDNPEQRQKRGQRGDQNCGDEHDKKPRHDAAEPWAIPIPAAFRGFDTGFSHQPQGALARIDQGLVKICFADNSIGYRPKNRLEFGPVIGELIRGGTGDQGARPGARPR